MDARIIQIGNSQGIRIPKAILQQTGLRDKIALEITKDGLLIKPKTCTKKPREGWHEILGAMSESDFDLTDEDNEWLSLNDATANKAIDDPIDSNA